ncbi:MAG TPA: MBL fold metallo-hydrolase [Burkholderiales bacterium]|nr:MBL fold metallo-hydrolase [Burkholderiales bacterium]
MKRAFVILFSVLGLVSCATVSREQGLVQRAVDAMGGADALAGIKTISVKGTMKQWEPEQSDVPGGEMRFANESSYEVVQDRTRRAARYDWEKKFAYPAPRTYKFSEIVTPDAGYVIGIDTTARNAQNMQNNPPAHAMSGARLATTQREAGRGALTSLLLNMRNNPDQVQPAPDVVVGGVAYPAVSYGPYIVAFDAQTGLPARVRTLDYDNVWGDVNYDLVYSQWRDFGGIKIPMNRKYELNGRVIQENQFTDLRVNPPVDSSRFDVPAGIAAGAPRPAMGNVPYQWVLRRQFIGTYLDSENVSYDSRTAGGGLRLQELAPGVQHVVGGSHNSLLVEMSDYLIVFDAPVTDAQSLWVVNAAKEKFPGKPIRWVVLTHHHMDHSGGVRGFLAEGATLVVGQGAGAHFRRVLDAPATRNPDMRPRDFRGTPILEVPESHVMSDARGRQVIVYRIDNPHAKSYLIGYVPDAKLGFVTDLWSPGRDPLPAKITPPLAAVTAGVKKAGIEPARFAGGHGSVGDFAPLQKLSSE